MASDLLWMSPNFDKSFNPRSCMSVGLGSVDEETGNVFRSHPKIYQVVFDYYVY